LRRVDRWRDVLARVEHLCGEVRSVEELPGGLTNVNLKVVGADRVLVVRVAQPGSALLDIDREHEHRNSVAAAEAGVGAPVVAYLPEAGLLVVEFLEGRTFTDEDLRRGGQLPRVAEACRRLHAGPRFVNDFDMFEVEARYLRIVTEHGFRLPARYRDLAPRIDQARQALAVREGPTVPCNNDLLAGNIIDGGDRLWLIDYEYSGNNDACFELGNLASEAALSPEQLEELVAAYDGRLLHHRVARARLWGIVAQYGWMLWASIQDAVSTLDVDFWSWGLAKYERAVAELDDPAFERLLAEATRDD
jgi:thiamine kinase-like enzyme